MKRYLRKTALLIVVFAMLTRCSLGQDYWKWSDPTSAHHSAVRVMVQEFSGARKFASGIYIEYGKLKGILTVKHLMRDVQAIKVITQDGEESHYCSSIWKDRDGHDIAFVPYENKGLTPLKIAEKGPVPGKRYEMVPLIENGNGPTADIRAFWMNCVESLNKTGQKSHNLSYYDGYTISGDSGAGILNERNEVVGIQSSGYEFTGTTFGAKRLHRGSLQAKHSLLVAFLNRLQTHETQFG